jgi:nucleoside-diphosphate-sugar epimerase
MQRQSSQPGRLWMILEEPNMNEPKETILITGTSGRLGYPVAKRLAETFNVVGFDRRAPRRPFGSDASGWACPRAEVDR